MTDEAKATHETAKPAPRGQVTHLDMEPQPKGKPPIHAFKAQIILEEKADEEGNLHLGIRCRYNNGVLNDGKTFKGPLTRIVGEMCQYAKDLAVNPAMTVVDGNILQAVFDHLGISGERLEEIVMEVSGQPVAPEAVEDPNPTVTESNRDSGDKIQPVKVTPKQGTILTTMLEMGADARFVSPTDIGIKAGKPHHNASSWACDGLKPLLAKGCVVGSSDASGKYTLTVTGIATAHHLKGVN